MTKSNVTSLPRIYNNNGQQLEMEYRFTLTGEIQKADNRQAPDIQGIQVKSARATICRGLDIIQAIAQDTASEYVYITKDHIAYRMTPSEYVEFATRFATATRESTKNGRAVKMRFKHETTAMLEYLEGRA